MYECMYDLDNHIAEGRKLYEISVVVNATGTAESSLFYS